LIEKEDSSPQDKWGSGSTEVMETPPSTPSDNTKPMDVAEGDQEESNHDEDGNEELLWYSCYSNSYVYNYPTKTKELVQLLFC
jgi:hypothetical protein